MAHERDVFFDAEKFHVESWLCSSPCGEEESFVVSGQVWPGFHTWPIEMLVSFFLRPYQRLATPRDTKTAEKIEVRMPRQCTTAKPRIAPEPKISSARPAIIVVTLESRIVAHARSKPAAIAACGELPARSSSRIRSLISTLASIAMPSVNAIAAMPGRVSVACISDSSEISSSRLTASANTLKKPNSM